MKLPGIISKIEEMDYKIHFSKNINTICKALLLKKIYVDGHKTLTGKDYIVLRLRENVRIGQERFFWKYEDYDPNKLFIGSKV